VTQPSKPPADRWTQLIAVFKLVKAVCLVAVAIGLLKLLHQELAQVVEHWIDLLQVDPGNKHIQSLLTKIWSIDDTKLKALGAGTLCYAALFMTEGAGLLLRKRWAHYFTIIVTASFLPLEIYEMVAEASAFKAGVIAVNVAIVVYLIVRVRQK